MQKLFLSVSLLFLSVYGIGQARDGTADLSTNVSARPAVLIYLPYSPQVVIQSLKNYLERTFEEKNSTATPFMVSDNTLLIKNNPGNAAMYFQIGLRPDQNSNESVVYLELRSNVETNFNPERAAIQFDMQEAKDYLDNLAVAIKPYATSLQIQKQEDDLKKAEAKSKYLNTEGTRLAKMQSRITSQVAATKNYKADGRLAKRKLQNEELINKNMTLQADQHREVVHQMLALVVLTAPERNYRQERP